MDIVFEFVNENLSKINSLIPSPIPVPLPITKAAEFISSQSFISNYRIKNVDLTDVLLWQTILIALIHPLLWNLIARVEFYTRVLSKVCLKPIIAVYLLALWIFVVGAYRDALFMEVIQHQEKLQSLGTTEFYTAGMCLMTVGIVLVLSSFYQLGMTGTYLGDYFGILMDAKVTAFPFNLFSDPMYVGSTSIFLGKAIMSKSPVGILLSLWVYIVYQIACIFENSFTEYIYSQWEEGKKKEA